MRSYVSMWFSFGRLILVNKLIQNLDNIYWFLVILSEGNKLRHSLPIVFKNAIKLYQAVKHEEFVALNL